MTTTTKKNTHTESRGKLHTIMFNVVAISKRKLLFTYKN